MATLDRSLQPLLAYWITQQKEAERARDKALADGKAWFRRAKLALDAGKPEMASEAKGHALDARDRYERARLRLEIIAAERDVLRSTRGTINEAADRARERRQHAMAEFQRLGIDPGFAIDVPDVVASSDDEVLLRLQERMRLDRTVLPAPVAALVVAPEVGEPAGAEPASEAAVDTDKANTPPTDDSNTPRRRFETIGDPTETES